MLDPSGLLLSDRVAVVTGAAAGIGLFIGFIGLQHGGIMTANPVTLVQLGTAIEVLE